MNPHRPAMRASNASPQCADNAPPQSTNERDVRTDGEASHPPQQNSPSVTRTRAYTRPSVDVDPAMRYGRPQIRGVPVDCLADMVWVGETIDDVADEYNLTRPDVLVACWYTGTYGNRTWRRRWKAWADHAHSELWHSRYDAVADPPTREDP